MRRTAKGKLVTGLVVACCLVACMRAGAQDAAAPVPADAAPENAAAAGTRVRVRLDVTGELVLPAVGDAAPLREQVEMTAAFDFDEWLAALPGDGSAEASAKPAAAMRRSYREASASMRVGAARTKATLAADAREVLVARRGTMPMPFLADGFLSGEESDLLETPFDTLLIDEILPREVDATVAVGAAWSIPGDLAAGLLAIDTVESGGLEVRIERVAEGVAEASISGIVDGAADGVPTHVTVEGTLTFSARDAAGEAASAPGQTARPTVEAPVRRVSVVIRELRQASHVAPGFELEARVLVERAAAAEHEASGHAAAEPGPVSPAERRRGAGRPGQVWYRDPRGRFDLVHDARWRRVENGANGLVLRLVDRGALVGQCSITALPASNAADRPTAADVQRDVERSLAGQIERTEAAGETDRADGLRVVRVVSCGTAGRLPFCWIHYVVGSPDGSQAAVTFMFEESMRQRFGEADRSLIESLRLPASRTAAVPGPAPR